MYIYIYVYMEAKGRCKFAWFCGHIGRSIYDIFHK